MPVNILHSTKQALMVSLLLAMSACGVTPPAMHIPGKPPVVQQSNQRP
ncbi:MAG: hypothetical protein KIT56_11335 [Gammaproteobacteria bacterium]|nr:hypothetical protein [Gammaproteobacteria bacterium]MCW5584438.1 hypothetical protein [Gammaproteobacteria bacterium]